MSTLGRNDSCWCGSGKKYKKCHMAQDQADARQRAQEEASQDEARQARLEALGTPTDVEMRETYERLTKRAAPSGPLPADAREAIVTYWQQERLTAQAEATLAAEREALAAHFAENEAEFDALAREVGQERYFDQYELTPANRKKVLAQLGPWPEEESAQGEYAARAVTLVLDDDDRHNFNEGLRNFIPDLVEAGRLKEAYVVAEAAERALDPERPPTPLLADVIARSVRE